MRRILIALGTTLTGLVLLFSWPTSLNRSVAATGTSGGTTTDDATSSSDAGGTTDDSGASASGTTDAGSTDPSTGDSGSTSASGTYDGAAVSTRYGDVQVRVTVVDGEVTSAEAISYPNRDRHDQQINAYAIPVLNAAAVEAQSADIDMVSGATVTSGAYVQSLQDALDQAGL